MAEPKLVRMSFPVSAGSTERAALYAVPCGPPSWRDGKPTATGEWHALALARDAEPAGVYLRRYTENVIDTTFAGKYSISFEKRKVTSWAVVILEAGRRFDSRADALRYARGLLEVTRD